MSGSHQPLRRLGLAAAALAVSGCVELTQVIRLRGDGSGEIVQSVFVSPEFIARMKPSGGETGGATPGDWRAGLREFEDLARSAPSSFGEGVTFVSAEPLGTDQAPGVRLTLAFADITRLDLAALPDLGSQGPAAPPVGAEDRVRFRFDRRGDGRRVLTAVFADSAAELERDLASAPVPKAGPKAEASSGPFDKAMREMVETLLAGLHVGLVIEVPELLATSSPHVAGNQVTLLDLDFDALLADPARFDALTASGDTSLGALNRLLADTPGVKFHLAPEVTIEFRD